MTGDLWQMTGPNVTCRTRKFKFEEISYVKRITRKELKVALRDFYLDDLEEHEYEGDDKECVDEEADFNLSESDDEPSKFY
jgi:hypothetical protein